MTPETPSNQIPQPLEQEGLITRVPSLEELRGHSDSVTTPVVLDEAPVDVDNIEARIPRARIHQLQRLAGTTATTESVAAPEAESSDEERPLTRLEELFKPVAPEGGTHDNTDNFDAWVAGELDFDLEKAAVREKHGRGECTTDSEWDARQMLDMFRAADTTAMAIIRRHGAGKTIADIPGILRSNKEARLELGTYLTEKLSTLGNVMPFRVRSNTGKSPKYPGYEGFGSLKSQEYVPLLALSMLDGTYVNDPSDTETYDLHTEKGEGQHRYAARTLLLSRNRKD